MMIILPEDKNIISLLSAEDAKQLLIALFSEDDDTPEMSALANMAYTVIKGKSDRIKGIKSRAGKQGGAPEGNQNAIKQTEQPNKPETSKTTIDAIKQTEQPSVTISVSDTISESNSVSDTEGNIPPTPPQAGGKRGSGKKSPKNAENTVPKVQFAEFVSMTNDEHTSLVAKLGEHGTARCIEILDNYKGSKGKKYDSDYRAILSWVITRYNEESAQKPTVNQQAKTEESGDPWFDNARRAVDELREE